MPADGFFDTSLLIYTIGQADHRSAAAEELLRSGGCISVQVLNEFANVARQKLQMPWQDVRAAVAFIRSLCEPPLPLTVALHERALGIAERYRYRIYDSLMIAAALECGCRILYSEDMQHGQRIGSLRIRNPFVD